MSQWNNSDYTVKNGERYTYSFEPQTPVKPKKRRKGLMVLAFVMCGALLAAGGGVVGSYLTGRQYSELFMQNTQQSSPSPSTEVIVPKNEVIAPIANVNPDGGELSLTDLFIGANPAVVAISTETTGRNIFGQPVSLPASGSGFFISENGYVATNNHVIDGADSITVVTHDGKKYSATLVGSDATTDLAVLKIDASGLSYLSFADSDKLLVGQQVAAIGNPLGELANTFTVGHISALDREINLDGIPRTMLQTDTAINSGNSGGPLLNMSGRVVGVVSAKSVGQSVEGLGFAIPSNRAKDIIEQLMQNGFVSGRAVMGVQISLRNNNYGQSFVYVESVDKGGAAEKAGVKAGDIILFANNTFVSSISDVKAVLATMSPGDKLTLDIQRNNTKVSVTLTLDEYKPVASLETQVEDNPERSGDGGITIPWDSIFPYDESPAA